MTPLHPKVRMEMCGLSTKVKVSGAWTDAKPHVKVSGSWVKVKKAYSKVSGTWENTYEYESVYTFSSGTHTDVDLDTLGLDVYHNVKVIIPADAVLVASTTSTYALKTGDGFTTGRKLTIENNGKILGRGGNGGNAGYGYSYNQIAQPTNGTNGGIAIYVEFPVTIDNNGTINGGGGGGGGGAGAAHVGTAYVGGGGGGGGYPLGSGGNGGSTTHSGTNGADGTVSSFGTGGTGGNDGTVGGGSGGSGGTYGASGSNGLDITGDHSTDAHVLETGLGTGGVAGADYYNPSSHTVTQI
jgi:hypothetical protein